MLLQGPWLHFPATTWWFNTIRGNSGDVTASSVVPERAVHTHLLTKPSVSCRKRFLKSSGSAASPPTQQLFCPPVSHLTHQTFEKMVAVVSARGYRHVKLFTGSQREARTGAGFHLPRPTLKGLFLPPPPPAKGSAGWGASSPNASLWIQTSRPVSGT